MQVEQMGSLVVDRELNVHWRRTLRTPMFPFKREIEVALFDMSRAHTCWYGTVVSNKHTSAPSSVCCMIQVHAH